MCITANLAAVDLDSTQHGVHLKASNRTYEAWWSSAQWDSDPAKITLAISHVVDMDASDTVYWYFYTSGGAAQTDFHGDSRWTGMLIG